MKAISCQDAAVFGVVSICVALVISLCSAINGEAYAQEHYEARFKELDNSVFVNADIVGNKATAYPQLATSVNVARSTTLSTSYVNSKWVKVNIPDDLKNSLTGLIVSGSGGSAKIKVEEAKDYNGLKGAFASLGELVVANGRFSTTLLVSVGEGVNPSSVIGVEMFDFGKKEFVGGKVVAISGKEVAVEFAGLSTMGVVTKQGVAQLSIVASPGKFINSSLSAWGYDIEVPDTDVGKPSPIKAWIYGLPPGERVSFRFSPISGQRITPLSSDYLVRQVNAGIPIAWIETTIEGAQPLNVEVRRER